MSKQEDWNQNKRGAILPVIYVISFLFLFGFLNDFCNDYNYDQSSKDRSWIFLWIGIVSIILGTIISFSICKYIDY
jgi:hypothetical protein